MRTHKNTVEPNSQMNAAKEKDEGGFSALPDYLHRAILFRLPVQCVVKTAAVSKQWKSLAIERLVEDLNVSDNEAAALDAAWLKHGLPKAASPERVDAPPGPSVAREVEELLRVSRELGADAAEDDAEIAQRLRLMVADNKELVPLWRLGWRPNWPLPQLRRGDSLGDGEAAMSGIFLHEQRLPSQPRDIAIVMRDGIFDADLRVILVVLLTPKSPAMGSKSRNNRSSNHHAANEWDVVKAIAPLISDNRHYDSDDLVRFLTEIASANSSRQLLLSRCRSCPAAKQPGSSTSQALRVERAIAALGTQACIDMSSEDLLSWSPSTPLPGPAASFLLVKFPFRRTRKTSGRAIEKALPMARAAAKLLLHNPKMTLLLRPSCAAEAAFNRDSLGSVMDRRIALLQQDCLSM